MGSCFCLYHRKVFFLLQINKIRSYGRWQLATPLEERPGVFKEKEGDATCPYRLLILCRRWQNGGGKEGAGGLAGILLAAAAAKKPEKPLTNRFFPIIFVHGIEIREKMIFALERKTFFRF